MYNIEEDIINYSKNLKLLYVEDNKEARESTTMVLEEFFDNITTAVNGEDGYNAFVSNKKFDLIITDINMPKLNGLEMLKKIRDIDTTIPVLVLSAYNESGYFMESIKLDVEGYLLKPIDIDQFLTVLRKVTAKLRLTDIAKKSSHLLEQYKEITDKSAIISILDTNNIITYVNDIFCEISQYSKYELIGQDYHSLLKYRQNEKIHKDIWDTIKIKKEIWSGVLKFMSKHGNTYFLKTTIKPILDEDNNIIEYISLRDDITQIMNPKKQLDDIVSNLDDPLLIYIKLEDYSTLEEFYDNVTVERIQDLITLSINQYLPEIFKFKTVYQLGNGEFALVNEKHITMPNFYAFISKLKDFQEAIKNNSIKIENINYDMSIIMSLVFEGENRLESAKLGIRKLLQTKNDFIISNNLTVKEQKKAKKNIETISMIKKAINSNNIISYFQPIINNKTKEIEKYESLVRLTDENNNILSPFFFLETSKKGKYYSQITDIVLDNSFLALEHTNMDISINLSALDIEQPLVRDKIFKLLDQYSEDVSRVVFELLEDENVKSFKTIKKFIDDVKKLGVKIAVDDFGAGYSNFERLLDYQPDILKIDGCLIRDIETNSYSLSVVKTIVNFAKEQNIKTIAEFVESEGIFNILNDLGVDYSQGYYFGKPEPLK